MKACHFVRLSNNSKENCDITVTVSRANHVIKMGVKLRLDFWDLKMRWVRPYFHGDHAYLLFKSRFPKFGRQNGKNIFFLLFRLIFAVLMAKLWETAFEK